MFILLIQCPIIFSSYKYPHVSLLCMKKVSIIITLFLKCNLWHQDSKGYFWTGYFFPLEINNLVEKENKNSCKYTEHNINNVRYIISKQCKSIFKDVAAYLQWSMRKCYKEGPCFIWFQCLWTLLSVRLCSL